MQKVLSKGHELIRKNKVQYSTLKGTLIEREHQIILDQLWKILVPRTYWNLVIYFVKFIIFYGVMKIARQSVGSRKLTEKQNVFDIPWMDKLVARKLPREFLNSIPVIKIEREEDLEEFPNWIVEDEFEENPEFNIENFPEEDIGSEIEENVKMNLSDPIKFTKMELVDDEDVETIIVLYCGNQSDQNSLIQLFTELASKEYGAQEPCMVAPISYINSQLTIRGIDIDLNVVPNIDVVGNDGYDNNDPCDYEVDSDNDPNMDEVPDDIDDEDVNDDGNINVSSIGN
ncbi:hypothetical protein J1N35_004774 [Gossypium stocksii]|uniref:Uncharacterized protein n=1 Tax=Gossypium stocksii TaxID=47602 RepID=A0A9D3WCK7_9ROSI|nr:hypothetical protein J1N35_004774 [Gossypium stocksii]